MMDENDSWMAKNWRPLSGLVYLAICVLDFAIMPVWYSYLNAQWTPDRLLEFATQMSAGQQVEILRVLRNEMVWKPVTLDGSGLFHMSFGAILGLTAWTRGQEKTERVRANVALAEINSQTTDADPQQAPTEPVRPSRRPSPRTPPSPDPEG